jgi:ribokinase
MVDIITCGSATIDVFASTDNLLIKQKHGNLISELVAYPSGGKMLIHDLHVETGGGGTNTAVGFRRLGFSVGYVGCIGTDDEQIKKMLTKEKISFLGTTVQGQSGYSLILDSLEHDRTIFTYKGANDKLRLKKIPKAKAYYFSSMINQSFHSQLKIAQYARTNSIPLAFNPSLYQVKEGIDKLLPILSATTVLIFNKEEAITLTKTNDLQKAFHILHKVGIPTIVITDGPHPIFASHKGVVSTSKPKKVTVVEATGAGDAFACAFFSAYIRNKSIQECITWGQANSESVLKFVGAKKGLLTKSQLLQTI